jgi:glycine hydroxymethyltransferase
VIAAKAVAFGEALQPDYKTYIQQVVANAKALAETLIGHGFDIVSGGTDNHLVLVDLRPKGVTGNIAEEALERAFITCNKNGIPFDPQPPTITSGVRLGTPAGTTRGFGVAEFQKVGDLIAQVLEAVAQNNGAPAPEAEQAVRQQVEDLCNRFPIY